MMVGPAPVAQKLPGKDYILRRHRLAIGKTRLRIKPERHVAARVIRLDRARKQAIQRKRLIVSSRHQSLDHVAADDVAGADQRGADALRGEAFDNERVEIVERAKNALNHSA